MQHIVPYVRRFVCLLLILLTVTVPFKGLAEYSADAPELLEPDHLGAQAAILIERTSGDIVFEKNIDTRMYPASTTKIMTVYLGLTMGNLEDVVTVSYTGSENYVKTMLDPDASCLGLDEGEEIVLEDLLYGCMLRSGNDAAIAIGEHISGSEAAFVDLMNQAAAAYGLTSTHFMNPHGLHHEAHYTTARDMAHLAWLAMQNETFADIAGSVTYNMPATNLTREKTISTGHRIMLQTYSGEANSYYNREVNGIKSGYTNAAQYCYVGSAKRDGVELISVVFGSGRYDVWRDTTKLMNYGFSQYTHVTFAELYQRNPLKAYVIGYDASDTGLGELKLSCSPVDPTKTVEISGTYDQIDQMSESLRDLVLVQYTRELKAPITAGETIGKMTYLTDEGEAIEYNLLATRSIPARKDAPKTLEEIVAMTEADPNPFPPMTAEIVLLVLSPFLVLAAIILVLRLMVRRVKKHYAGVPKNRNRYVK